jgi:hypothetical protein
VGGPLAAEGHEQIPQLPIGPVVLTWGAVAGERS